ncbi:MAG: hypothetical protein ACI4HI_18300 [Lachnospiraceae bacterium]
MQCKDWKVQVMMEIRKRISPKYLDGGYIESRIVKEEFTPEDINEDYYFLGEVLKSYISCENKINGKKRPLSKGECKTISMLEGCLVFEERYKTMQIFLMAYLHDMDPVLLKYLPAKVMGKYHRRRTNMIKYWDKECYGFWHPNCKTYLPLDKEELEKIEEGLKVLDVKQLEQKFDSENVTLFAQHVCEVIELAFENKKITTTEFSLEACQRAVDLLEGE